MSGVRDSRYLRTLDRVGLTTHFGGQTVTRRIMKAIGIQPGQRVLDVGCGTGFTASMLAAERQVGVVALDVRPAMIRWAKRRLDATRACVRLVQADAHNLPFKDNSFDAVLVESVLIMCEAPRVAREAHRVLKPGGGIGCDELTVRRPLPAEIVQPIEEALGIDARQLRDERQWRTMFVETGFVEVSGVTNAIDWLELALITPIKSHGLKRFVSAMITAYSDPDTGWSRNRSLAMQALRYLGFGVYTGRKALVQPA